MDDRTEVFIDQTSTEGSGHIRSVRIGQRVVFDLDRPDDLAELIGSDHRSRTATACLEMELGPRLLKMGIGPTLHQRA